ncbi:MAG: hypothetical protein KDD52_09110, partial [Bdellovibrionales bacterium]|nr:hypothetical protein [Bdellovibrionales bacterium]
MKTQVWLDYKVGGCRNIASVFLDSSQSEMQVDSHWFSYGFDSEGQVFVKDISDSIEDLRIYLRGQFVRPHWSLLTSSYLPILILILLFLFGCCVRFIYVLSVEQHKKQLLEVPRDEEVLLLSDFIPQEYENNLSVQSDQGLHTLDTIDDRPRIKQNSNVTRKKQKPKYTFRQSYGKLIEGKFELAYQEIEKNFSMYPMKEQVKAKKILGRMYRDRCDSLYQR